MKIMGMRSLLIVCAMTLFVSVSWAQTVVTKEVKKQAKSMKKEGWKVNDGDKSIEIQLADLQRYMSDDDYIVESASQISKSYHLGYTSARAKALRALSLRLSTLIASDTEIAQTNVQKEDGEAESQVALNARIKSMTQETLSNAFPVLVLSRQLPDGTCEVQVHLAIEVDD